MPFLKQHHARITHVHVKDRKLNEGAVTPFGEGDTPIVEALHADSRQQVADTSDDRVRVPDARGIGSDDRAGKDDRILQTRARVLEQKIRRSEDLLKTIFS